MPDNSIHIEIDASQLEKLPEQMTAAVDDPQTRKLITTVFAKELLDSTDRAFKEETDPYTGTPWAEWSPAYVQHLTRRYKPKAKTKKGNSKDGEEAPVKFHKKLQDKGMKGGGLRSTIQTDFDEEKATIGSNLRYARIHQLGGMAGRGHRAKIPARPYLGLDQKSSMKVGDRACSMVCC